MSKIGENIRELATLRRTDAHNKFGVGIILGLAPVLLHSSSTTTESTDERGFCN